MSKPRLTAWAALLLLGIILPLRLCRRPGFPVQPPGARPVLVIPAPPSRPAETPPAPRTLDRGQRAQPPERLLPFLVELGRARLLHDRRALGLLSTRIPPLYPEDVTWLCQQASSELFVAAGSAELIRRFRLMDGIPALAQVLAQPKRDFLKDVVIETLGELGGDAAATALLGALTTDADSGIRARCATALGRFQGPEAYHALVAALGDPRPEVRSAASLALSGMKSKEAVEILLGAAQRESDPTAQADLIVSAYNAGGEAWREPLVRTLEARPLAAQILRDRALLRGEARYARAYDRGFFEPGAAPVPYDPQKRRIGITLELGAGVSPREVAQALFGATPFDRYRAWFYFRLAQDFPAPKAYDSYGNPTADIPYGELDGTVFLHFKDPQSFTKGVLGYTRGCDAYVTGVSLLHEVGHAFAQLADEYPSGSTDPAPNLSAQAAAPWQHLIEQGILGPSSRRDAGFYVPSENCHMGNRATDTRLCPVCQLEIHARLYELAGIPLPWSSP